MEALQNSGAPTTGGGAAAKLIQLRNGVFGAFYVLGKKMKHRGNIYLAGTLIISLLQLISFLSTPVLRWPSLPSTAWLSFISNIALLEGLRLFSNETVYLLLFYSALLWALIFCGLFAWTTYCFMYASFPALWPLHLLRAIASLTVNELYIPILNMLITALRCDDTELQYGAAMGVSCFSTGHLVQAVICVVLALCMFALCGQFALIFYDSDALSRNVMAKAHGRGDFVLFIIKTVLVVFVRSFPRFTTGWGCVCTILACALLWFLSTVYWLPFLHHNTNRAVAITSGIFVHASLAALLAQLAQGEFDAGIMFFAGIPPIVITCIAIVDWRAKWIHERPLKLLTQHMEVEIKVRYQIHQWLYGHIFEQSEALTMEEDLEGSNVGVVDKDDKGNARRPTASTLTAAPRRRSTTATLANANKPPPQLANAGKGAITAASSEEAESHLVIARAKLTRAYLEEIESTYREACWRFKTASMLHLYFSRYYAEFRQNKHLEMSHLMAAERVGAPFDVGFLIYKARKQTEDSAGGKGDMSALQRVTFEKFQADARKQVARAMQSQVGLWAELLNPVIDLAKLHDLSTSLTDAEQKAEEAFTQLLHLNPQSLLVLRLYSEFCLRVQNNPEKASLLVADAERIEEAAAKEHAKDSGALIRIMQLSNLDVMSDTTGVFTISGSPSSLGTIISVNSTACRMFGYSRWQLERRNISLIVPPPMSSWHDLFLRRYLSSGEGTVVDYTRCLFGLHKNGYLIPLIICVRESNGTDKQPEYVGLVRPLATPDHHILMDADFMVMGATIASLQMLDLEASALSGADLNIRDWIPEFDALADDLRQAKGSTVCFNPEAAKKAAAARQSGAEGIGIQRVSTEADEHTGTVESGFSSAMEEPSSAQPTWGKAHLQEVVLQCGLVMHILYWQRLATDKTTMWQAEAKRSAAIATLSQSSYGGKSITSGAQAREDRLGTQALASPGAPGAGAVEGGKRQRPITAHSAPHPIPVGSSGGGCPVMLKTNALDGPSMVDSGAPEVEAGSDISNQSDQALLPGQVETSSMIGEIVTDKQMSSLISPQSIDGYASFSALHRPQEDQDETVKTGRSERWKKVNMAVPQTPGAHVDAEDEQSKFSSGESTATRKMITSLRRVLRDRDETLLPALQWLRVAGILMTVLSVILAIVVVVVSSIQYTAYASDMQSASAAAMLLKAAQRCGQAVREMTYINAGFLTVPVPYAAYLTSFLQDNLKLFDETLETLKDHAFETGRSDLYMDVNTMTTQYAIDPYSHSLVNETQLVSLMEASLQFKAETEAILALKKVNVSANHPSARYILDATLRGEYHEALNRSMLAWFRNSVNSKDEVVRMWTAVYATMSALLFALAVLVFLPVLVFVDQSKDEVVRKFTALPRNVLLKLRSTSDAHLKRFIEADEEEEAAETDEDDSDGEDREERQAQNADNEDDDDEDWDKVFRKKSKRARQSEGEGANGGSLSNMDPPRNGDARRILSSNGSESSRSQGTFGKHTASWLQAGDSDASRSKSTRFKKSRMPLVKLSIRFTSPLVALFLFFTILHFVALETLHTSLRLSSVSYVGHTRSILILDLAHEFRALLGSPGHPDKVDHIRKDLARTVDELQYVHRLLMFGGVPVAEEIALAAQAGYGDNGGLPENSESVVLTALTGDICEQLYHYDPTILVVELFDIVGASPSNSTSTVPMGAIDMCRGRLQGLLTHGFHGAIAEYVRLTKFYVRRRMGVNVRADGSATDVNTGLPSDYSIQSELRSSDVIALRDLGFSYLAKSSHVIAQTYAEAGRQQVESYILFQSIFCTSFLVLFTTFMAAFYLPAIVAVNNEIHQQRALLLLLPSQVIRRLPEMRQLVQRVLVGEGGSAKQRKMR